MILLPVSEAYAFDYIAILEVKAHQGLPIQEELDVVSHKLREQLGDAVYREVIASQHYHTLYCANRSVFDAVAASASSPTQVANRARYRAKVALQKRFWPDAPLAEHKTKAER
jgi:hypothetical protein